MTKKRSELFDVLVKNKFNVYNSLFLNLPYRRVENIGVWIPLLNQISAQELNEGKGPTEILEAFFDSIKEIETEKDKIDFMFRVVQYVERQVVLYDSVEDAAFPELNAEGSYLSIHSFFKHQNENADRDTILEKLSTFSARLVFTAHPTQFYPPSVLNIIHSLRSLIQGNNIEEIYLLLRQLGLTSFINSKKPTPLDEAKNIIYFLRNVYYKSIGELYAFIKKSVPFEHFENHDILKLGFWPGGDRDGNPFVTAKITMQVADELRTTLMKCYYHDIKALQRKLTFSNVDDKITDLRNLLYKTMFDADHLIQLNQILDPLEEVKVILQEQYNSIYLEDLVQVIDKVKIFKCHFANLDIRQDHSVHIKAIQAILKKYQLIQESLEELDQESLIQILLDKDLDVNPADYDDELIQDTLVNIRQLKDIQRRSGEEACNRYIISNSEDIFSVLFVIGLFRWSGWALDDIRFDIVPLFETMEGMRNSENVMRTLFSLNAYQQHVQKRKATQTIMLGFSDGTKDGGYLQANWSIQKTKEVLSTVCDDYNMKAIFFDGRGGPPARGGGKTHRFYAAQGSKIANHEIQLTIQGQTITSTYGTKEQFIHNSEQLITAGLSNEFNKSKNDMSDEARSVIEELANASFDKYNALKHHDKFISYLENKSTLKYYTKANIGSRPGKRGNKAKLELTDLRAISFVGSWSQLKQNVPGYFGIGTALKALKDQGRMEEAKSLFRDVPFFKAIILNCMMSLKKCYFELTSYMADDPEYGEFWKILFDEFKLSKELVLEIADYHELMQEEQLSKNSILMRENIVLPLLIIQQYALQKVDQKTDYQELYEKIVTRSLYGNINASRNSA